MVAVTHPSLPISVTPQPAGAAVQAQLGSPAGALVTVESQGATGTLYTVPANKVFSGLVFIQAAGSGSVTVSAVSGGTLASESYNNGAGGTPAAGVPVTVAGGGGGNAISLATSGNVSIGSVSLIGHVK
jgi:hypothetical protein